MTDVGEVALLLPRSAEKGGDDDQSFGDFVDGADPTAAAAAAARALWRELIGGLAPERALGLECDGKPADGEPGLLLLPPSPPLLLPLLSSVPLPLPPPKRPQKPPPPPSALREARAAAVTFSTSWAISLDAATCSLEVTLTSRTSA